jgi:hypothetical protein
MIFNISAKQRIPVSKYAANGACRSNGQYQYLNFVGVNVPGRKYEQRLNSIII